MLGVEFAPTAKLLELDLFSDELFILARPIIDAIALGACKFEKLILRHNVCHYIQRCVVGQAFTQRYD